ncbi:hypothetical protein BVER_00365c [Candidatus Burkholderia verschuerenii]|uniref:Uncharacterized protein n=1 Tax=Candidatus Burkholderia verschuerenii TaxID=242163 RepID=A0A0L0M6W9_9BURK|nr:hypothetical protein [Candidatus Burkholderia verschuerenii]KND58108.1 hypothetical protein BVER_00365c [Candidatus Burkholderia verschuerenii]
MKDHEIRELVSELTEIVPQYGQTQQLREHIREAVFKAIPPSLLAASSPDNSQARSISIEPAEMAKEDMRAPNKKRGAKMSERYVEVKTFEVDYLCDALGCIGFMRPTGTAILTSDPPKFTHACSACGDRQVFEVRYPTYRRGVAEGYGIEVMTEGKHCEGP